jgi:non-heme chloroperoxidase
LEGKIPLLYIVREEWKDAASSLAAANTPSANIIAMGKHLMFWERHTDFNAVLDRFLARLE